MAKKASSRRHIRKKTASGSKSTEVVYHSTKEIKVERELIENFIGLQKVMVNLSVKFDSLSSQISKLLDLFEISAKALAKKEMSSSGDLEARKIMEKLENISQQAGLIGKGLSLIHKVRTENEPVPFSPQRRVQFASPAISPPMPQRGEFSSFEKSLASRNQKPGEDTNVGTNI